MKNLIYFVENINTSFVINDIKILSKKFEKVFILSEVNLVANNDIPNNVILIEEYINWKNYNSKNLLIKNLFSVIYIYLFELFYSKKYLSIKNSLALICSNIYKANSALIELNKHISSLEIKTNSLFYSFWFYDCNFLSYLKYKKNIKKSITRAHGGDLFEERSSLNNKVLLRNFQLKNLDKVFSVSNSGSEYLKNKYPKFKSKISTSFLGSLSHKDLNKIENIDNFNIVSCAKVRDIKRIYLIAETLADINFPLTWYHIGDENLDDLNDPTTKRYKNSIANLKNNKNIKFVPLGLMSNQMVFNFYKENQVNLFISLSEAEGIPVSMMEAISFGIPILSTDVGGCKEIVNDKTGILIPVNPKKNIISKTITDFKNSEKNNKIFRTGVRQFWEENFDIEKNYNHFLNIINE